MMKGMLRRRQSVFLIGAGLAAGAALLSADKASAPRDEAGDKAAFVAVCGACHDVSMVSDFRTESEWSETVDHMVSLGATGTDEQFERVMRVLLRTLTTVNVNTATASQLAPVLDISDAAAQEIVSYRTEHGAFKTLEDLKRTPGLDGAKLDARKDRIAF
jgi:competence ComEA-like helix-hairpin-helix protein